MKLARFRLASWLGALRAGPSLSRSALTLSDDEFFALLSVEGLADSGRRLDAREKRRILVEHFGRRVKESWLEPPRRITDLRLDLERSSDREILERANRILDYDLHPSGIRPRVDERGRIDWARNRADSREWLLMLNRHAWWPVLGKAYRISGEERYAAAFCDQLVDWIDRCPPIRKKNERDNHWRLMETALRLRISWLPSFALFYESASFSGDAKLKFLRSLHDHATFLFTFKTNRNHLLRESNGLLAMALRFPEFVESGKWRAAAIERLSRELEEQVNEDGSQIELSTGYQWLAIDEFETTYDLLEQEENGFRRVLRSRLEDMYEFAATLTRPDGSFPQINDGFLLWSRDRLEDSAEKFARPDFGFVGSLGQRGTMPAACSRAFHNAGLYIMRSGWSPAANWLVFDAGSYGGPHGHEDKLSVEIAALGRPFIIDPGCYTYQKDDPYRDYFVGSHSHNTVLVDGYGQVRRWQDGHMQPRRTGPVEAGWHSDQHVDYARGVYAEGYGSFSVRRSVEQGILVRGTHSRHVLFLKPDYWCIFDSLAVEGAHRCEALFQVAPGLNARAQGTSVTLAGDEVCLDILPVGGGSCSIALVTGETDPPRGWYSPDHFKKEPATTVRISREFADGVFFATILSPRRAGQPQLSVAPTSVTDRSLSYRVESAKGRDEFEVLAGHGDHADAVCISCRRYSPSGVELARFDGR